MPLLETEVRKAPDIHPDGYTMYKVRFRRGMNLEPWLLFWHKGDLSAAINRSREFCRKMNYVFLICEHALVDLETMEREFGMGGSD